MAIHKDLPLAEMHAPFSFEFDDSIERLGYTPTANDLRKLAFQEDDSSIWFLLSDSPVVWVQIATTATAAIPTGAAGGDLTGFYPNPEVGDNTHSHDPGVTIPAYPTTLPPNGAAGGDLDGTYPNPTLATIPTITSGTYYKATVEVNDKGLITNISANTDSVIPGTFVGVDLSGGSTVSDDVPYGDDSTLIPNTKWATRGLTTRELLESTETYTIPINTQRRIYGDYVVEGILNVSGKLILDGDYDNYGIESLTNKRDFEIPHGMYKIVCSPFINEANVVVKGTLKVL